MLAKQGLEGSTGILFPLIGMEDQGRIGLSPLNGSPQGRTYQIMGEARTRRPADYLPREEIQDGREIQPSFFGRDIGDIGDPYLVGILDSHLVPEKVFKDRILMMRVGSHAIPSFPLGV